MFELYERLVSIWFTLDLLILKNDTLLIPRNLTEKQFICQRYHLGRGNGDLRECIGKHWW